MAFRALTLVMSLAAWPLPLDTAQRSAAAGDETMTLVLPARRAPDAPPAGPPALPPGVNRITPLTLQAVMRRVPTTGRAQSLRQTITRTADRVHVARSDGREWLFEQNTVDPRRVSAYLIEHSARAIVRYEESDLRLGHGIRGWADVLSLGFDAQLLNRLRPTGRTRTIGGIRFAQYGAAAHATADQEVSWSREQGFPGSFVTRDATAVTTFSIERVAGDVDMATLKPPAARFPSYRLVDLAEWLEHR